MVVLAVLTGGRGICYDLVAQLATIASYHFDLPSHYQIELWSDRMSLRYAVVAALVAVISLGSNSQSNRNIEPTKITGNTKVDSLFDSFRKNEYRARSFPDLTLCDVPALLKLGESDRILTTFPRNLISSQFEINCSEGMVALWLIEGIRQGKGFPSLNSLCLGNDPDKDWTTESENNRKAVLASYQQWWKETMAQMTKHVQANDPLAEGNLNWH